MPDKHNNKIGNNEIGNGFDADLHSYRLVQRNCPCLGKLLTTRPECAKNPKISKTRVWLLHSEHCYFLYIIYDIRGHSHMTSDFLGRWVGQATSDFRVGR